MNRITPSLIALAAFTAPLIASGQDSVIRALEARLITVEERLAILEEKVLGASAVRENEPIGGIELPEAEFSVPDDQTYVIRDGDSLGGIARKFDVPRQALLEANNMVEGQPIYIGETLVIPGKPKTTSEKETQVVIGPSSLSNSQEGVFHTVQAGDTLSGLSRKYGTPVSDIKRFNNLQSDVIATGQKLMVSNGANSIVSNQLVDPEPSQGNQIKGDKYKYENPLLRADETYGYYIVQKGDNLYALARDFFTTLDELQRLNKLGSSTIIHTGDELVVPTSKYNAYHNNIAGN